MIDLHEDSCRFRLSVIGQESMKEHDTPGGAVRVDLSWTLLSKSFFDEHVQDLLVTGLKRDFNNLMPGL